MKGARGRDENLSEAGLVMSNAWELWTELARSSAVGTPEGRDHMLKRHEIVVRIIEANSRRLKLDNELNGLDIERRIAERDLTEEKNEAELRARLAAVEAKLAVLREESSKLDIERDWLGQSLDEFDGKPPTETEPQSGRA